MIKYRTSNESFGHDLHLMNEGKLYIWHCFLVVQWYLNAYTDEKSIYSFSYAGQKISFSFDEVFDDKSSQEDVFMEISELIQSVIDGNKVIILHGN